MTRDEAAGVLTKALCVNHDNRTLCQATELAIAELRAPRYDPTAVKELLKACGEMQSVEAGAEPWDEFCDAADRVRESRTP